MEFCKGNHCFDQSRNTEENLKPLSAMEYFKAFFAPTEDIHLNQGGQAVSGLFFRKPTCTPPNIPS